NGDGRDVLLVAVGVFGELGVAAADLLAAQGIGVTVVDPRWVVPVPRVLTELAASHRLVVTIEDSGRHGGFGSALAAPLRDAGIDLPLRDLRGPPPLPQPSVPPPGPPARGLPPPRHRVGRPAPSGHVGVPRSLTVPR